MGSQFCGFMMCFQMDWFWYPSSSFSIFLGQTSLFICFNRCSQFYIWNTSHRCFDFHYLESQSQFWVSMCFIVQFLLSHLLLNVDVGAVVRIVECIAMLVLLKYIRVLTLKWYWECIRGEVSVNICYLWFVFWMGFSKLVVS